LLSSSAIVGSVAVGEVLTPIEAARIAHAGSVGVEDEEESEEEALPALEMLSRSSTHCTVCATAADAFAIACEGVDFKSSCTVANSDWAVFKFPALNALPSAVMSVASCALPDELVELLLDEVKAGFSCW
jgi:hypothetical protein